MLSLRWLLKKSQHTLLRLYITRTSTARRRRRLSSRSVAQRTLLSTILLVRAGRGGNVDPGDAELTRLAARP